MEPIVGIKRVCFFAAAPEIMEGNPRPPYQATLEEFERAA